jgi:hypothetical protein
MMPCFQVDRMGEACDLSVNLVRSQAGLVDLTSFGQNGDVAGGASRRADYAALRR